MRLEQAAKPGHVLRVSAQLIAASTILHLSSDELEGAVAQEQMENPALEIIEQRICLFCGAPLHGQSCTSCGYSAQLTQPAFTTNEITVKIDRAAKTMRYLLIPPCSAYSPRWVSGP